ncbi:hypothetical protein CB1_000731021 [Camelus ferus]|nr:hypothetical protein CB1_000731021 [Camelus ferus]
MLLQTTAGYTGERCLHEHQGGHAGSFTGGYTISSELTVKKNHDEQDGKAQGVRMAQLQGDPPADCGHGVDEKCTFAWLTNESCKRWIHSLRLVLRKESPKGPLCLVAGPSVFCMMAGSRLSGKVRTRSSPGYACQETVQRAGFCLLHTED